MGNRGRPKKENRYDLSGEYGIGFTPGGEEFYFDLEDFDKIKEYPWRIVGPGYIGYIYSSKDKRRSAYMHRLIMDAPDGTVVDHINHDTRDNRKANLRVVSQSNNLHNRNLSKRNKSGHTGICYDKGKNYWEASMMVEGVRMRKCFKTDREAIACRTHWEHEYKQKYSIKKGE